MNDALKGTDGTLGGVTATDRDFVHAIYGNFPYVLAFVMILTLILLARAFRSIVLPIKAVLLNLVSLGAAFGIVVLIFQEGHGSGLWNITATQAITAWIPLMIFAFLFGLSMDYEVFMLSRMREAYDETGSTTQAIELGLARTGKLVTSAALILMFAFLVLSSSPGFEIKEFAIGLAAGIIFDATVIRALLVPSLMRLMGRANWWMPDWARTALFLPSQEEDSARGSGARRGRRRERVKSRRVKTGIHADELNARRELLLGHVAEQKLDGYVLFDEKYIQYFTSFGFLATERPVAFVGSASGELVVFVPGVRGRAGPRGDRLRPGRVVSGVSRGRAPDAHPRPGILRQPRPAAGRSGQRRLSGDPRLRRPDAERGDRRPR